MFPTLQNRDFIANVISDSLLEEAIDWIECNLSPEDIFNVLDLEDWAESNGYTLIDD